MAPYQPLVIADLDQGLDVSKEAWISPEKAWRELRNGFVFRGRLRKRPGYQYLGTLGTKRSQVLAGTAGLTTITGTLDRFPVLPRKGTYEVTFDDGGGQTVVDAIPSGGPVDYTVGQLHQSAVWIGIINYQTGAYAFALAAPAASDLTVTYEFRRVSTNDAAYSATPAEADQNAVMLIEDFIPDAGNEILLATDRRRLFKWSLAEERFVDLEYPAADRWTGCTASSFHHAAAYLDKLVLVNGLDVCHYYDGTLDLASELATDWIHSGPVLNPGDAGYTRQIDSALMAFMYRSRLVLLRTVEGGSTKSQRARWSKVAPDFGASDSFAATDFADAPTNDRIVSAGFLRNTLVIFFERSTWALVGTEDFRQAFVWQKIAEMEGSFATRSTVSMPDAVVTMGKTAPVATDGQSVRRTGDEVPDIVLGWNSQKLHMCYAILAQDARQVWSSFADAGEAFPEHVLAYQYDDGAFAIYDLPMHVFGSYKQTTALTWDEMDTLYPTFDDWSVPFDDPGASAGFPLTLGGGRDCCVWGLFRGTADAGGPIKLTARTQRLAPFRDQQQRARLGYVDVIARSDAETTLTLRFYGDSSGTPYLTRTITLDAATSKDQVKRRVLVNRTAAFHELEIEHNGTQGCAIDALVFWLQPVAEMRSL